MPFGEDPTYPWEDYAEAARLVAHTDRPWVLVGHALNRTHAGQIRAGKVPAFVEGRRVPYEVTSRAYGGYGSIYVRYTGRKKWVPASR
jgi:hypothetical protein